MSVKLKDLYIGVPDGATEAQDEKFEELFFDPNNKYEELMSNNDKFIILGSKGTGKTYLANYVLKKARKSQETEIIDADSFLVYKLSNIDTNKCSKEQIYVLCRWYLLDKLSNLLLKRHKIKSQFCPYSKIYKLRKFLNEYENLDFFKEINQTIIASEESTCSTEANLGIKEVGVDNKYGLGKATKVSKEIKRERKPIYELVNSYENLFFSCLSKKDDIILIIDDLDELEKHLYDDGNGSVIVELIKVAKSYNLKIKKCKGKFKIILLLRSDILDKLQGRDANLSKIKTSCSVELYWLFDSMREQYEHPLMSMVLHKIKAYCKEYSEWSNKKLFNELFPEEINNKRPLDYLLDHGFGRPRDIITYLNHAKVAFPDRTDFSSTVLKESKKLYSADFYNEILNQASFHRDQEYVNQCLNLISSVKKASFDYETINTLFENYKSRYDKIDDLDKALAFLYEIGAIGNVWKMNKKSYTSWYYKKDAMDEIDLSKKFTIHYGLRKKFSL